MFYFYRHKFNSTNMMIENLLNYFACKWTKLDDLDLSVVLLDSLVGFM